MLCRSMILKQFPRGDVRWGWISECCNVTSSFSDVISAAAFLSALLEWSYIARERPGSME